MKKHFVLTSLVAIAIVTSLSMPSTASAYSFLRYTDVPPSRAMPNVVPPQYYDYARPLYRSQRGRSEPSTPTTVDFDYVDRSSTDSFVSEKKARNTVRELFERIGIENQHRIYDNDQFSHSQLELQELVSHSCFEPVGSEIDACKQRLGSYYNLKESILDGSLYIILVTDNPDVSKDMKMLYQKMIKQIQKNDASKITMSEMIRRLRRNRMQAVWDVCQSLFQDQRSAAACYVNHNRLFLDEELLDENINFLR